MLNEAFDRYQPQEVFLSFNGGKDCTVLLDLVVQCLLERKQNVSDISYIYVQPEEPFEEVEVFVKACEEHYNIVMQIYRGNLKTTLEKVLKDNTQLKACILGSRRTDPYCEHLNSFQPTDHGWPQLMRVSPLLDWTCDDVWRYLIDNRVPYCSLYDAGYTSIGDKTNTIPNPHLQYRDLSTDQIAYRPAYELKDDRLERAGRK